MSNEIKRTRGRPKKDIKEDIQPFTLRLPINTVLPAIDKAVKDRHYATRHAYIMDLIYKDLKL